MESEKTDHKYIIINNVYIPFMFQKLLNFRRTLHKAKIEREGDQIVRCYETFRRNWSCCRYGFLALFPEFIFKLSDNLAKRLNSNFQQRKFIHNQFQVLILNELPILDHGLLYGAHATCLLQNII